MDKLKNNIGVIMVILGLIGSTGTFYSKFATMELKIEQLSNATAPDLTGIETNSFGLIDLDKNISILENYGITELNIAFIPADLNPVSKLKYLKKVICSPDQEKVLRELLAPHIDIKVKITPARESTK